MRPARNLAPQQTSNGGRLVATDGRTLPLESVRLSADARGGLARVVLEQRFANPHDDPLAVTYLFPLPADAAVSGFAFRIGERRVVGEVDRKAAARERYEEALIEGRTAALVEQERSSLFTQELGNVPPRAAVVAEITLDQRLAWLSDGAWEWRFPTTVAPRYLGAPGRVADAQRVEVDVADGGLAPRLELSLAVRDPLAPEVRLESPSHRLALDATGEARTARLADEEGAPLDRDLVVRWAVASQATEAGLALARPPDSSRLAGRLFGLLTLVPPAPRSRPEPAARDLVVLLDTSGSMSGRPLDQAKHLASALVRSLGTRDRLELVEFSSAPRRWKRAAKEATERNKADALAWIAGLEASGGTEMRSGLLAALAPLRPDAQRQVVLVTDGLIGFEREVVAAVLDELPARSRLHTVGVGSAVNRSLTLPAARAGRGVEVIIGLDESPEPAARRLLARTELPLVTEVEVAGKALRASGPSRLPDLFAGAPVLVPLELTPEGGALTVRGQLEGLSWEQRLEVRPVAPGEGSLAAAALFGRERVEDLEMRLAAGSSRGIEEQIERTGLDFQIATRLTSWLAVSEEPTVDSRRPLRRERMPQQLPYGVSAEGLGLRAACFAPSTESIIGGGFVRAKEMAVEYASAIAPPMMQVARALGSAGRSRAKKGRVAPSAPEPGGVFFEKEEARGPTSPKRLEARIVLRKGKRLVVEIAGAEGFDWDPEERLSVELADGTRLEARLDRTRTTAPMSVGSWQVLRLALELIAAPGDAPVGIELTSAGEALVLRLIT